MKKMIKNLLVVSGLALLATSCYDDYKKDFDYTATYFSMQSPFRTVLVEDGKALPIEVGAMLSGRYVNENNETVDFEIDSTMLDGTGLTLLPAEYYTLSNESQITIPSGKKLGTIDVNFTEAFLNDSNAHKLYYALPFKITSTSLDSILPEQDSTIVAVKYQNEYYGVYRVKGVDYAPGKDTVVYSNPDFHQNEFVISSSLAMDTVVLPYVGNDRSGKNNIKLAVNDGDVTIMAGTVEAGVTISGNGSYVKAVEDKKTVHKFYLDYDYTDKDSIQHQVMDTLIHFDIPMSLEDWNK